MESSDQNIIGLFLKAAHAHPDRIAFVERNSRITFGSLLQQVKQTAYHFQKNGIKSNDAVLVFVSVSIALYRTVLALFYLGAVPVFLDGWAGLERIKQCCTLVHANAIIAPRKLLWLTVFIKTFRTLPVRLSSACPGKNMLVLNEPRYKKKGDAALITFTTGTASIPKAAIRTHGILQAQFNALSPLLQSPATISLTLLPVVVLLNIGLGRPTVLSAINPKNYKPRDAHKLVQLIRNEKINSIIASPFLAVTLAKHCKKHQLQMGVTEVITGGGPVFPDDALLMIQAFPQATITMVYGSTEAEPISHIKATALAQIKQAIDEQGLPAGKIDDAATVAVLPFKKGSYEPMTAIQWQQLQVSVGTVGEIAVKGNHVVKEYIANEEAMRLQKIYVADEVWHRTGDAGRLDEKGVLFLYGPCSEVIQYNRKTVYPFLAEYGARQVQGITDAALFKNGDTPMLAICITHDFDHTYLNTWLTQNDLEGITIHKLHAIPKDPRHRTKVDYKKLREKV